MSAPFVCERTVVPVVLERRDVHTVVIVVVLYLVSWKRYKTFDDMRPRVINPTAFSLGNSRSEYYQLSSDSVSLSLSLSLSLSFSQCVSLIKREKKELKHSRRALVIRCVLLPSFPIFIFEGKISHARRSKVGPTNGRKGSEERELHALFYLLNLFSKSVWCHDDDDDDDDDANAHWSVFFLL